MSAIKTNLVNLAVERAMLAALIRYGEDVYHDLSPFISSEIFHNTDNKVIFYVLESLIKEKKIVDIPSFLATANSLGLYNQLSKPENLEYINSLFIMDNDVRNAGKHCAQLYRLNLGRKAQGISREIYQELNNLNGEEKTTEIISILENKLIDFTAGINDTENSNPTLIADGLDEYVEHLLDNPVDQIGVSTGYAQLDDCLGGGIRPCYVYLLAARPKTGKTTMAANIILNVSRNNIPVLYLDTEMSKHDIIHKMICSLSNLNIKEFECGNFSKEKIVHAVSFLKTNGIYYKNISGKEFDEVKSIIRRWVMTEVGFNTDGKAKPCLIVYDYFKLMTANALEHMPEHQAVGFQITELANLAQKHHIPILTFNQVNRDGLNRETSDILAQSDRLLWIAACILLMKKKSPEEILSDGADGGNFKIVHMDGRFGGGLDYGDYINYHFDGPRAKVTELGLKSGLTYVSEQPTDG